MSIPIPRTPRARGRAVLACATLAALAAGAVPAGAHSPSVTGTIKHGGTSHGATWGERVTVKALTQSGCTSTVVGGTDLNNFDAAVLNMSGLALHKVSATYSLTIEGTTEAPPPDSPPTGMFLEFYDKTCKQLPLVNKEKAPPAYGAPSKPTPAITVPPSAKWLIVFIDAEARSATYKVTVKHPPAPKKKKR